MWKFVFSLGQLWDLEMGFLKIQVQGPSDGVCAATTTTTTTATTTTTTRTATLC